MGSQVVQKRQRGRFGRRLCAVVAATVLVGTPVVPGLSALVGQVPAAEAADAATLRVSITQEIDSLNPFLAVRLSSTQVGRLMYEYLTTNDPGDFSPKPGLAESWETAEDDLTWTFHIREGMTWSDGEPITAKDAAFTYNLIMTDEVAATANGSVVTNYESVEATDDNTLVIKTKKPQASMLTSEVPIVPEHIWSKVTDLSAYTNLDDAPKVVGSGPYTLEEFDSTAGTVTLTANPDFWRGKPKIDTLQFVTYENSDAAAQGLKTGEVDVVNNLTPVQLEALSKEEGITTAAGHNRRYTEILMNPSNPLPDGTAYGDGNPALKDVKFRQALAYAIDLETLVEKVKGGQAQVGTQLIPPVFPDWHYSPDESDLRTFDPDRAKELLDEAGYTEGPDGIRLGKDGQPINLRLIGTTDLTQNQQAAEYIKDWFADIGIGLTPSFVSTNQSDDAQIAGNYDLAFSGWSVSPDPDQTLAQQTCAMVGTDSSDSNYCNADYDKLYTEQQTELDHDKRVEIVQDMQKLLYDNVSALILSYDDALEAYRSDRFEPFKTMPADGGVIVGQSGYAAYANAAPVSASDDAAEASDSGGLGTGGIIAIVAGGIVVVGGAAFLLTRRKSTADERE